MTQFTKIGGVGGAHAARILLKFTSSADERATLLKRLTDNGLTVVPHRDGEGNIIMRQFNVTPPERHGAATRFNLAEQLVIRRLKGLSAFKGFAAV